MGASREVEPVNNHHLVLFDGVCNLCSASVRFIIKRDPEKIFRFASLQSAAGQRLLERFHIHPTELNTIVLVNGDQCYQRSNAALEIARKLSGGWPLLYLFKIIPAFLRDWIYNLISRNRYRLFGKQQACWIPTPELASRFID